MVNQVGGKGGFTQTLTEGVGGNLGKKKKKKDRDEKKKKSSTKGGWAKIVFSW